MRLAVANNKPVPEFLWGWKTSPIACRYHKSCMGEKTNGNGYYSAFFKRRGKPKLMAIAGYSGIGKSALVHEVHKPIATYSGFLCR